MTTGILVVRQAVRTAAPMTRPPLLLAALFVLFLCATAAFAQDAKLPALSVSLTEVEWLKGDNLRLRYDSLDKQLRLLELQYAQLREQQAQTIRELQQLEQELVTARRLPPDQWTVNWQTKKVEPSPQTRGATEKERGEMQ